MNREFASADDALGLDPSELTQLAYRKIRSPHDIPYQSLSALVECWSDARMRTFLTKQGTMGEASPEDLFIELVCGVRIAQETTAGRWCVVADLLRSGAVDSWSQIADAMGVTETEARDGFRSWIAGQADLHRRTGTIGLPEAEAAELYSLSAVVSW